MHYDEKFVDFLCILFSEKAKILYARYFYTIFLYNFLTNKKQFLLYDNRDLTIFQIILLN